MSNARVNLKYWEDVKFKELSILPWISSKEAAMRIIRVENADKKIQEWAEKLIDSRKP